MEILRIEDLSLAYPQQEKPAFQQISLSVEEGSFHVICGPSGCGKTTLLHVLKRALRPKGTLTGKVFYCGRELDGLSEREAASEIGLVRQDPEQQIVTDRVWHELAFGLENLGVPRESIRRRVGEMASFFGIQNWFRQETATLSGGQKQLLNLASVMVMQPKLLLLDEPTSQLDPIAASDFLAALSRLHRELGLTVILAEHRLEEALPLCDRVSVMYGGRLLCSGAPKEVGRRLTDGSLPLEREAAERLFLGFPAAMRLYRKLAAEEGLPTEGALSGECPLSVREGRVFLRSVCPSPKKTRWETAPVELPAGEPAVSLSDVWFRYEKSLPDVVRGAGLTIAAGEFYCLLGGNGTGKTTLLHLIAGLRRAYRGTVRIFGEKLSAYKNNSLWRGVLSYLPQDVRTVFVKDTVREDLRALFAALSLPKEAWEERLSELGARFGLSELWERHPYDLSGGEQQKCALAKLLVTRPRLLLLDEPTKGLDAHAKRQLGELLKTLCHEGTTVFLVTHDMEFAAQFADRCGLFFDGGILAEGNPGDFFGENQFYTTAAKRITDGTFQGTVTCEQAAALWEENREIQRRQG